jgi:hypothetical protein
MEFGDSLHVHGPVSRSLLVNLSEFNAIWHAWRPEKYRMIQLHADKVIDEKPVHHDTGYIYAFSGGVDACASLRRNLNPGLGWGERRPGAAMIVHGFDIPLECEHGFDLAYERAQRITSSVKIPLVRVKTNIRELPGNWEDCYAAVVSAVLMAVGRGHQGGVYAADEPYLNPVLPWGSNPISNIYLSSGGFPIHSDGAELTRIQKVDLLTHWPEAKKYLRVCWAGEQLGSNCGKCEKCVRTQLEFMALGAVDLSCFDYEIRRGDVENMVISNEIQKSYLVEVLELARKRGVSAWWVCELENVVKRYESRGEQPGLKKNTLRLLLSLLKERTKNIIR